MSGKWHDFFFRKKTIDDGNLGETKLARVLNTLDLTALGVGSTLGAGIYVLAGSVIKNVAGPSVVLSFIIAAIASVLAGLCYAEFGARVPKTGSAYVYTYVTVGEFLAFVIGWNLILEYVIGTSSVARAFSTYFDSLFGNAIQHFFIKYMPMHVSWLSKYPDFFAAGITLLITGILCLGVKESSRMNNIFTVVNLSVVGFIIIAGAMKADFHNWSITPSELPTNNITFPNFNETKICNTTATCGNGGFFPFGVSGMLAGAAKCFYAFVGFDCIATTGEEVRNPQRAIPISIILSLLACTVAYCGVSAVLSLMLPYFLINEDAPMPDAFFHAGWNWARYLVAIGAICSLSTSLLGAMFPLPRVLYAIASDGLIFKELATISQTFRTPLLATILSGVFAAAMAALFDLDELVNMMSIGTLLAYSLVAISVLVLRYRPDEQDGRRRLLNPNQSDDESNGKTIFQNIVRPVSEPTQVTSQIAGVLTTAISFNIVVICVILVAGEGNLDQVYVIVPLAFFSLSFLAMSGIIWMMPQNKKSITFKMPLVPLLPILSIFINFYLMALLNYQTWIRFAIWMIIGLLIYFIYSVALGNSVEGKRYNRLRNQSSPEVSSSDEGSTNPGFSNRLYEAGL